MLCAVAALVGTVGCKGSFGDSCSGNSDCEGSLTCFEWPCVDDETEICSRSCEQVCATDSECPNNRRCSAGLCVRGTRVDSGPTDAVMEDTAIPEDTGGEDAGEADAGEDSGAEDDAGADDAGADDAGSEDAGADDAGSEDAGSDAGAE